MAVTGVHSGNDVEWWEDIYEGIDLDWEHMVAEAENFLKTPEGRKLLKKHGYDSDSDLNDVEYDTKFWDEADEKYNIYYNGDSFEGGDIVLFGGWKKVDGLYEPDEKSEYSAIYNRDHNTIQVLWSRHIIRAGWASPCYPNQADIDCGGELRAYMLPVEMMYDNWVEENKERFIK